MAAVPESFDISVAAPGEQANAKARRRYLGLWDIGVLLAALGVFLLFLLLLNHIVFPQGSRLAELASLGGPVVPLADDRQEHGFVEIGNEAISRFVAKLADVRREVKMRPADSVAWKDAVKGTSVGNRDAVQTFANSRARVDFTTDNELRIGQNSLVIFRSGEVDPFLARRDAAVVIMDGEISGEINADYGDFTMQIPAGLLVLRADRESNDAVDFRVSVNPDNSSTIAIYSGEAEITVAGQRYLIMANYGLTISEDGQTSGVRALPSKPRIRSPQANATARYRDLPPRVDFRWGEIGGAEQYRLELAKDAKFEEILVDEYLNDASFTHGNLAAGNYFWRISARNGWLQGPTSETRSLRVVRDAEPPLLELEPVRQTAGGLYLLQGRTSGDATVYVHGNVVRSSPGGDFVYEFEPEPGTQTVLIEAVDDVGNVTYSSQIFHAQSSARRGD